MTAIYSGVARVGRDAEVRYVPSGEAVVNLSLAFSYGKRDADGKRPTTWVEASLWGKRAETLAPYLVKGQQVWVTIQDLRIETFTKSDGSQGNKLAGRLAEVEFVGGKPANGETSQAAPRSAPTPTPAQAAKPAATGTGFDDMDDDIPF